MAEAGSRGQQDLEESVRRVLEALERVPTSGLENAADRFARASAHAPAGLDPSARRALARASRRLERRRRTEEQASVPHAFVFGLAAVVAASVAIAQPQFFWLLFVAFGFAMGAADNIAKVRSREKRLAEEARAGSALPAFERSAAADPGPLLSPPTAPESPVLAAITAREKRVDGICDRLLGELKSAPVLVRELLRKPEETVEALRGASKELARRERALRALLTEEEGERLLQERRDLASRAETAPDAVVKSRLASALQALDAQLTHRAELSTAAARIEAEGTRILYSLESLRSQVLRAFAADAAAAELTRESLKGSLETLSGEIDAVATALEEVHGVGSAASTSSSASNEVSAVARAAMRQAGTA